MPDTMEKDNIILGSGHLFLTEFTGDLPEDAVFEDEDNNVGHIKGGAELTYTPTEYEVTNDEHQVVKRYITKEEVAFKSGILTWFMATLAKFCPGVLSDDATKKESVLKIGGGSALKNYALRFVHTKANGFKLRVTMVATASSGFTLAFKPDAETVVDAQFKAKSQDDGTLVEIRDQYAAVA